MNIKDFLEKFNENYSFLYDNYDNVAGYYEALEYGEKIIRDRPSFVQEFVNFRGDFLSSDREVAALGFTLADFENFELEKEAEEEKKEEIDYILFGDTIFGNQQE